MSEEESDCDASGEESFTSTTAAFRNFDFNFDTHVAPQVVLGDFLKFTPPAASPASCSVVKPNDLVHRPDSSFPNSTLEVKPVLRCACTACRFHKCDGAKGLARTSRRPLLAITYFLRTEDMVCAACRVRAMDISDRGSELTQVLPSEQRALVFGAEYFLAGIMPRLDESARLQAGSVLLRSVLVASTKSHLSAMLKRQPWRSLDPHIYGSEAVSIALSAVISVLEQFQHGAMQWIDVLSVCGDFSADGIFHIRNPLHCWASSVRRQLELWELAECYLEKWRLAYFRCNR